MIVAGKLAFFRPTMPTIPEPSETVSISKDALVKLQRLASVGVSAVGAAHEINNLLTVPLTYSQLSKKHPNDQEIVEKALNSANRAFDAIRHISSSMLDFVSGKRQGFTADIRTCAETAITFLYKDPNKNRTKIVNSISPGIWAQVHEIDLQQMLLNLLLNAMNAIQRSGKAGQIRLSALSTDGQTIILVSDTGPGLPENAVDKLFTPFLERSDDKTAGKLSLNQDEQGNGLGLLVCKQLAEANGGQIRWVPTEREGTTFEITLNSAQPALSKAV
jgi:C4-dicarboxylate-specific signal transduction histidine kinase